MMNEKNNTNKQVAGRTYPPFLLYSFILSFITLVLIQASIGWNLRN